MALSEQSAGDSKEVVVESDTKCSKGRSSFLPISDDAIGIMFRRIGKGLPIVPANDRDDWKDSIRTTFRHSHGCVTSVFRSVLVG